MSNVVSLDDYKKRVTRVEIGSDDRVARIRESVKKINKLMEELRSVDDAK